MSKFWNPIQTMAARIGLTLVFASSTAFAVPTSGICVPDEIGFDPQSSTMNIHCENNNEWLSVRASCSGMTRDLKFYLSLVQTALLTGKRLTWSDYDQTCGLKAVSLKK
jgi:hypothetical protein